MYGEAPGMRERRIREVLHLTRSPFLLKCSSEAAIIWENCEMNLLLTTLEFDTIPFHKGLPPGKAGKLGANNLHAQGGYRIGLIGQACHAKVQTYPARFISPSS